MYSILKTKSYNYFLTFIVGISIIPLCVRTNNVLFDIVEYITCVIFAIDYLIRYCHYIYKDYCNIYKYPITISAIIDLLAFLPIFGVVNKSFNLFKIYRIFRVVKLIKQYQPLYIIVKVIKTKAPLLKSICVMVIFYVFIIALIMFNVESEKENFNTFFDAIYWSVCTLTTVGYGDIYPLSTIGKSIAMISSMLCIGLIALPSAIISGGYMEELNNNKQ